MIDEKKLIEYIDSMPDRCNLFRWRRADKIRSGLAALINLQPRICEWIPCSERLPEEKINPITGDFQEYDVTFSDGEIYDVRHYKFGKGHWWHYGEMMDKYVTAWMPLHQPYMGNRRE